MRFDRLAILALLTGCGTLPGLRIDKDEAESCGDYPAVALYQLPWNDGAHTLLQGNCGGHTHKGVQKYAYDFAMPIGTTILAARAGTIEEVVVTNADGVLSATNYITIRHADGTLARYLHLTQNGASVAAGDYVAIGQAIGQSGNSGLSTTPHLHFEVDQLTDGLLQTMPVSFSDAGTTTSPLAEGGSYPTP